MNKKKIMALVPMKGHSERIPHKNIQKFNGQPLFYWIINSLYKSHNIDKIFVDTDSRVIANLSRKYFSRINIIWRPKKLRGDFVSMNKIIEYDIAQIKDCDFFLQTHSTNPMLKTETIDRAITTFLKSKDKDSLFTVDKIQSRFYDYKYRPINHNPEKLIRTQDLHPIYRENSNLYIFTRSSFNKTGRRIGSKPIFFPTDSLESLDIDTKEDFILAENVSKFKKI